MSYWGGTYLKVVEHSDAKTFESTVNDTIVELTKIGSIYDIDYRIKGNHFVALIVHDYKDKK